MHKGGEGESLLLEKEKKKKGKKNEYKERMPPR